MLESTASKVRTFLFELTEGTSNYRSLHSLTEQVEHQYHGRFVVELLQNAHDALSPVSDGEKSQGRIEIAFKNEGLFGALYVANDGHPFSESNFAHISQLGQSDKDPQESIGNKGIGFRSVLEISSAPEVFSRASNASSRFDGFCFGFSPDVIHNLAEPILALFDGVPTPPTELSVSILRDWHDSLSKRFRSRVSKTAVAQGISPHDWLRKQLSFLSPYLLPLPLGDPFAATAIADFERCGFATIIRLPLKSSAAATLVCSKIDELNGNALLFLDRAASLALDSGRNRRDLTREISTASEAPNRGTIVSIREGLYDTKREYSLWSKTVVIAEAPSSVQAAVKQLPGKWPELSEARVSIAVRVGAEPEQGTLSVVLPTLVETGCAAHVSGAFFAEMSRTDIEFGSADETVSSNDAEYNRFLLLEAARLAVSVIADQLTGGAAADAQAVIDLLAPFGSDQKAIERWKGLTIRAASEIGVAIEDATWFLSDEGWGALSDISLLPDLDNAIVFTNEMLRKHAAFSPYARVLDSRCEQIEALSQANEIPAWPAPDDLADTVESIADELHANSAIDWNAFWHDADAMFDGDFKPLVGKRVLLGNDGQLHSGGSSKETVFFVPVRGGGDDENFDNSSEIKDIPSTLRPFVAFLDESISILEEKNGRLQQTRVRKLLFDAKLVSQFRRDDIVSDVLIARTPKLPIPVDGDESLLCRDILQWALRLMIHLVGRGSADPGVKLLQKIASPCQGGWYPLGEVAFGPGWAGTNGDITLDYLSRVKTTEAQTALERLLLPPSHESWEHNGDRDTALLRVAGVFDGLKLTLVDQKEWPSRFHATKQNFFLPEPAPLGTPPEFWRNYRASVQKNARPIYNSGTYEVTRIYVCPGFADYADFDDATRLAFMRVFMASVSRWPDDWETIEVKRVVGYSETLAFLSPFASRLRGLSWLGFEDNGTVSWSRASERWHVPASELTRGRHWQFTHLRPLPSELANRLDTDSRLKSIMHRLGTPLFDPETKSASTALLDALADAVRRGDVPNWDVFLGQVRSAWRGFEPTANSPFLKSLLVQRAGSRVDNVVPTKDEPVCLPDSRKSFAALKHFQVPVIAIEPEDAKRLADRFSIAFPGAVIRASELRAEPLVNGEPWVAEAVHLLRDDPSFNWLGPVLLTISAFHGAQSQGTTSRTFRRQLDTLRQARLVLVEQIQSGLFREDKSFTPSLNVPALWLATSHALLVARTALGDIGSISESLSDLLEREDLEVPIRLMLGTAGSQPDSADILRALDQLKLTEPHYLEVREHWRGDVGHTIEMLIPLLTVLSPAANIGHLVECDSDQAVIDFLDGLADARFNGETVLKMAHDSADVFEFGRNAHIRWGGDVQLVQWNAALSLRDQPPLVNRDAASEFNTHLASALPTLRSLLASLPPSLRSGSTFRALLDAIENLSCPEHFANEYWEVTFAHTAKIVAELFENLSAPDVLLAAIREASSVADLRALLNSAGINLELDPLQTARDNREKLRIALARLQQIGLAWAVNNGDATAGNWETRATQYTENLAPHIEATAFTSSWSEQDLIGLFKTLPTDNSSKVFWLSVAESSSLDDLVVRLGLSPEALATAKTRLGALREEATRKKRIVQVCGGDFDGAEENFPSLWQHIRAGLPEVVLQQLKPVDLTNLSSLLDVAARKKRKRTEQKPTSKTKRQYSSKTLDELIGLTGEIHAFRMLQQQYGSSVVSASNWVSENSLYVYPDNKVSDGIGCDFLLELEDRLCHIEVKSSSGDDEGFFLGSSEINLALRLAGTSRRRRKEAFLILHVSNALSLTPSFQLLPNPYERQYASLFVIDEANARVRYELDRSQ